MSERNSARRFDYLNYLPPFFIISFGLLGGTFGNFIKEERESTKSVNVCQSSQKIDTLDSSLDDTMNSLYIGAAINATRLILSPPSLDFSLDGPMNGFYIGATSGLLIGAGLHTAVKTSLTRCLSNGRRRREDE